jgi:predicted phage tail protein
MKSITIIFGTIAFVVASILFRAWALTVLWAWFLVPLGMVALSISSAIGISIIVGMFTQHLAKESKDEKAKDTYELIGDIAGRAIGAPLLSLFFGWIVTLFM